MTVMVMATDWVWPPPVAVTVTVRVPGGALRVAETWTVAVPDPGAAIELGLTVAAMPAPLPEVESEMGELKLPEIAVDTVVCADELRATVSEVEPAESVKPPETLA